MQHWPSSGLWKELHMLSWAEFSCKGAGHARICKAATGPLSLLFTAVCVLSYEGQGLTANGRGKTALHPHELAMPSAPSPREPASNGAISKIKITWYEAGCHESLCQVAALEPTWLLAVVVFDMPADTYTHQRDQHVNVLKHATIAVSPCN